MQPHANKGQIVGAIP